MGMTLELSADQLRAVDRVCDWFRAAPSARLCGGCRLATRVHTHGSAHDYPVMAIGGLAGTGKTTVAKQLAVLGDGVTFAAPTHKAAAVLRGKIEQPVGTYHSLVYRPAEVYRCRRSRRTVQADPEHACDQGEDCRCEGRFESCGARHAGACLIDQEPVFTRRVVLDGWRSLIVVDEASMLTDEQVADIRVFGVPLLLIGDHGQLPPVRAQMNSWMAKPDAVLTVNHRQGEGSGIVALAHRVRAGGRPTAGSDGDVALLDAKTHPEAVQALLERFTAGQDRAVIVWRNKTRADFNAALRGRTGPPQAGDRVVRLRGCELPTADHGEPAYVHNGALGTVASATHRQGARVITLHVQLDTGELVKTVAALHQFGEAEQLAYNDVRRPAGRDWQLWDYAYAITAHKAQGSEFDDVIVVDENPRDYAAWMYTAVTRAAKRLVVVKW